MIFLAVAFGYNPAPVDGTDRPDWVPNSATEIRSRTKDGFGWWRVAEFTISEDEALAYADLQGWELEERSSYSPPGLRLLDPERAKSINSFTDGLVYEDRKPNNGGTWFSFDRASSRGFVFLNHN